MIDGSRRSVIGGSKPDDDLWLNYDIWISATEGAQTRRVHRTSRATMRSQISASANKIWPNTTSKVPDKYLSVIEASLGWRPDTNTPRAGSTATMEGIWYDLGNVGQGFDNDGDGIPDRNIWMQPVGDPSRYSPLAARMVKAYGLVIVKLNDGTEKLIPFEDQLYFTNIPENNRGAVGLVFYEFIPLTGGGLAQLSPYQEVASGRDNEKYNGDYGNIVGSLTAADPKLDFTKTGPTGAGPGDTLPYALTATNAGEVAIGDLSLGLPLVFEDAVPDGLTYIAGSATATNTLPAGTTAKVTWSTDGGTTWVSTEPVASSVNRIRWTLSAPLAPATTATVRFEATVSGTYSASTVTNTGTISLGGTGTLATATAVTNVGSFSIGDLVWQDANSDGAVDAGETGIPNVTVRLYRDVNNNGVIDSSDTLVATTVSDANGAYLFNFLQNQRYIVSVDTTSAGLVSRFGTGLYTNTTPVTKLYATLAASATDADFGFRGFNPGSIGDLVYFDKDENNAYDPAIDVPLANVTVRLLSGATVIATTSTDLSGRYLFGGLAPGTYSLEVDLGDPDIPAYMSAPVSSFTNFSLLVGQNDLTRDFRFVDPGNITKQVNLAHLNTPGQLAFTLRPSYTGGLLSNAFVQDTLPVGTTFASAGQGGTGNPVVSWQLGSNTAGSNGAGSGTSAAVLIQEVANPLPTAAGDTATASITSPAGVQVNDLLLLTVAADGGTGRTITTPNGWIALPRQDNSTSAAMVTYYRIAASGGAVTYSVSLGATGHWSANLRVFRNVDTSNPIEAQLAANGSADPIIAPSVSTTVSDAMLVGFFTVDRDILFSAATMDAATLQQAGSGAGSNGSSIASTTLLRSAAGATGNHSVSGQQSRPNIGRMVALRPAVPATSFTTTTGLSTNQRRLVTGGTRITVTLTASAAGNAGTVTAPTNLTLVNASNGVSATKFSGPTPATAVINNSSASFIYEYDMVQGSLPGSVAFRGSPTSTGATWGTATSASVLVTPPLTLTVNVPGGSGQSTVTNTATFGHNTNVFLGQSQPTVTTLDGSIGDFVWADVNGDGLQAGESGIAGVRVYVDSNGNSEFDVGEPSAITNHLGAYTISGLGAGTYTVRYDLSTVPSGYVATTANSLTTNLTAGQQLTTADFGLRPPGTGSIGDFVWRDVNGNGLPNSGEPGISGVTVTLYRDLGTPGVLDGNDIVIGTTTTSASGAYLFNNLHSGSYLVAVDPLASAIPNDPYGNKLRPTTATIIPVTLAEGQAFLTADFGFGQGATIGDTVFFDLNGNGTQDYNETGIGGVTVRLFQDDGTGQPTGPSLATVVSADGSGGESAGFFRFTGLLPGPYYVLVDSGTVPSGLVLTALPDRDGEPVPAGFTGPAADSNIVVTWGGNYTGADFGYQPPGVIGDFVWLDLNGNGQQEPGEPGIADVVLEIANQAGTSTFQVTDFDGYWATSVADGTWTVTVLSSNFTSGGPLEFLQASHDADGLGTLNSTTFTISGGEVISPGGVENLDLDFGYRLNGSFSLSGTVLTNDTRVIGIADDIDDFFDDGEDMDAGPLDETELPGITVYLYRQTGADPLVVEPLGSAVTDANGRYRFEGLPAGTYRVIIGTSSPFLENSTLTTTVDNNPATTSVENTGTSVIQTVTVNDNVSAVDFAFVSDVVYDYGDLPLSYGMTTLTRFGARHVIPEGGTTVYLGSIPPDAETNGIPTSLADGDDRTGDDEDGVVTIGAMDWIDGPDGGELGITVNGSGWLVGWIDWNNDRDFLDAGELVVNQAVTTGIYSIKLDIPPGTITGASQSWLSRFRVFTERPPYPLFSYTDTATDGEVEDHLLEKPVGGSIGSFVWNDLDGDGVFDLNEVGIGGILVRLEDGSATPPTMLTSDGTQDVDGDGVIDPPGYYRFRGLSVGTYQVVITNPPAGYTASYDEDGTGTPNTSGVSLANGVQHLSANFGYEPLRTSISGTVWYDIDRSGGINAADTGAEQVVVQLWTRSDGKPDRQVGQVVSTANGDFEFFNVPTGDYLVIMVPPDGSAAVTDADGGAPDRIAVSVSGTPVTGDDFLIDGYQKCADRWSDWISEWNHTLGVATGPTDNSDGDRYNNLLEYAFCLRPDSGVGKPFCLESDGTGGLDGVFTRTAGGPTDVTVVLEHAAALGAPTIWTALPLLLSESFISIGYNGDGSETVRIMDIETVTGLTSGSGFVRIRADLDDGSIMSSAAGDTLGWVETSLLAGCQTYNNPFMPCAGFSGTVSSVSGQDLVFATSAGSSDLGSFLTVGSSYYLEVTSGIDEGHRFDVVSASGNTVTLPQDSNLDSLISPFSTRTGAPPVDLQGASVILRRHRTLDEVFPPTGFMAGTTYDGSDQVQLFAGGAWTIYWLYSPSPGQAKWVSAADSSMSDMGAKVIPPGYGMFFNNLDNVNTSVQLLAFGEVRETAFVRPLAAGNNLVGGGYPVTQAAKGDRGRGMTKANGFFGSLDYRTADSFFVWKGDQTAGATGYDTFWMLDRTAPPLMQRWVRVADGSLAERGNNPYFVRDRAAFLRNADPVEHRMLPPWIP